MKFITPFLPIAFLGVAQMLPAAAQTVSPYTRFLHGRAVSTCYVMHGHLTIAQTSKMEVQIHSKNGMTKRQMVNLNQEMDTEAVNRYIADQGGCESWLFEDKQAPVGAEV